jgi:hypothetical protein
MGNFVKTGHYDLGSFMIGCYNQDNSVGWPHWTPADNDNEIVLRFNDDDTTTYSFRLITGIANNQQIGIDAMHMGTWWISNSDSTLKKNIQSVNEYDILSRIRNIPVKYWQWKDGYAFEGKELVWQEHHQTLMGPMAQDFTREFPIGVPDNKHLNTAIIDAVTIASIQSLANITDTIKAAVSQQQAKTAELDEKTDELLTKTEFQKFKDTLYCYADACKRIEELEGIMQDLYNRIEELEDKLNDINEEKENPDNSPQGINEKSKFDDIMLMQNNPNPFAETTEINYYIPSKYSGQAKLIIADEKGTYRYQEFEACFGKPCQIKVSAKELNTGVYLYGILINGRLVKSQKMMIIK